MAIVLHLMARRVGVSDRILSHFSALRHARQLQNPAIIDKTGQRMPVSTFRAESIGEVGAGSRSVASGIC
jgi:hypothetical protein